MIRILQALALLIAGCGIANAAPSPAGVQTIDAYFSQLMAGGKFNGIILVARGDAIIFQRAYGFAEVEQRAPLTIDGIFRIGSLTKPVTSSLILQAIAAGKLALADRLCDRVDFCLPSWSNVTLEHLLSHGSGITDHFGDLRAVPVEDTVTEIRRAMTAADRAEALKFAPGSDYSYYNFNYVLAAAMLEQAEGRGWRDSVRDMAARIRTPSLDYDEVRAIVPGRVRGYDRLQSGALRNIDYDDHAAYAAGGLRSTAADFFRWSRAALQARLFPAMLRDNMLTPRRGNYGLGWQITKFHGRHVYDHTGGIDGFSSHIAYYPIEDTTILVFTNVESDSAILFACDAAAFLFGVHQSRLASSDEVPKFAPARRCGISG